MHQTGLWLTAAVFMVLMGVAGLYVGAGGCGGSSRSGGGGGGSGTVSTDATANAALVTAFIAQGNVTGTWTNNNFGSTGDFEVTPSFNAATGHLTMMVNVDGAVFGGADPDTENFDIDLSTFIANGTDTINFHSDTYGDITADLRFLTDGTGTFTATATNIPGVTNGRVTGSFSIANGVVSFRQDTASFTFGGQNITVSSTIH